MSDEADALYERVRKLRNRGEALEEERASLDAQQYADTDELIVVEARGKVPRGVRRRGKRLEAHEVSLASRELRWDVEQEAIEAEVEAFHAANPDSGLDTDEFMAMRAEEEEE